MIVLYVATVLAGFLTPFFIDETKSSKIICYTITLLDILAIAIMVFTDFIVLPSIGKNELFAIGIGVILVGIELSKIYRIAGIKPRFQDKPRQRHKAAH